MHVPTSLTEIALVATTALLTGLIMTRLKQPSVLGYVLAGVILGPSGLSLVHDRETVGNMAELGVLLLLFIIGMELNLKSFRETWKVAVSCVFFQVVGSVGLIWLLGPVFHWQIEQEILFGFIIALSSTAVAITLLEETGELKSAVGKLTISILIAQDLVFVPMTLIIRSFSGESLGNTVYFKLIFAMALLVLLIYHLSQRERVKIPYIDAITARKDLSPLLGLTFCFSAAALTGLLDISAAYGAFLAGLILGNTSERNTIIKVTRPTQSVLMMVFFLSVGLLVDLQYVFEHLFAVLTVLLIVFLAKTALNVLILRGLGKDAQTAFVTSLMLAQIGEFSFVLATIGVQANLLDLVGSKLVIALTVLSLLFSPLWMTISRRIRQLQPDTLGLKRKLNSVWLWTLNFLGVLFTRLKNILLSKP